MGNGSICCEKKYERVRMPSISSTERLSTSSSLLRSSKILPIKPLPPPVAVQEEGFKVNRNADQYSSIWDYNAKVSSSMV